MKYIQVFILLFFTLLEACVPKPTPISSDKSSVCSDTSPVVFVDKTNAKPYGIVASEKYVYWVDVKKEGGESSAVLHQTPIVQPENSVELVSISLDGISEVANSHAVVGGLTVDEREGIAVFGVGHSSTDFRVYVLKRQESSEQWGVFKEIRLGATGMPTGVEYLNGTVYWAQFTGSQKGIHKQSLEEGSEVEPVTLDFNALGSNRECNHRAIPPRFGGLEIVGDYLYFTDVYPCLTDDEWLFRVSLAGENVETVALRDPISSGMYAILIDHDDGVFYTGGKGNLLHYWTEGSGLGGTAKIAANTAAMNDEFYGVAANSTHLFFTSFNNKKIYKMCKPKQSGPNLVPQNVSIDFATKTVNVTVKNIGNQRAGEHSTVIEINSTHATDRDKPQSQSTLEVPALEAGESKVYENISFDDFYSGRGLNVSSLNCANLVVHVDAKDVVAESNEIDNLYDQSTACENSSTPSLVNIKINGNDFAFDVNGRKPTYVFVPEICKVSHGCPWCAQGLCPGFSLTLEQVSGFDIQVVNSSGKVMSKAYGKADTKTLQIKLHKISSNKKQQFSGSDLVVQFNPRKGIKSGSHQIKIGITQKQLKKELK